MTNVTFILTVCCLLKSPHSCFMLIFVLNGPKSLFHAFLLTDNDVKPYKTPDVSTSSLTYSNNRIGFFVCDDDAWTNTINNWFKSFIEILIAKVTITLTRSEIVSCSQRTKYQYLITTIKLRCYGGKSLVRVK